MPELLGCTVTEGLLAAWKAHLVPERQPFFASKADSSRLPPDCRRPLERLRSLPLSQKDTFGVHEVSRSLPVAFLLDETTFSQLKGGQAQELLASNRAGGRGAIFVWEDWIGELEDFEVAILREAFPEDLFLLWPRAFERLTARSQKKFLYRFAAQDQAVCKRRSISGGQWTKIDKTLPGVRAMAGTFLPDSGGNCFATAMTAFEPELVAELWVQRDAFETWLEERRPVAGAQIELGTLLVWRSDATVAGGNRANPQPLPR